MALQPADEITGLLRAWSEGDESALDLLMPLVYGELHRAAHRYMASFLIPLGTGSFYAGNVPHGVIHLTVGVGAALQFLNNFCVDECSNDGETKAAVGFAVFVVNWVAG